MTTNCANGQHGITYLGECYAYSKEPRGTTAINAEEPVSVVTGWHNESMPPVEKVISGKEIS